MPETMTTCSEGMPRLAMAFCTPDSAKKFLQRSTSLALKSKSARAVEVNLPRPTAKSW